MSVSNLERDPAETTVRLVERIRAGDAAAKEILVRRYFAALHRWARGRLPAAARNELNTEDLVQETLLRALGKLDRFEARENGSFLAYLRQILKNRVRDELRKWHRRPHVEELQHETLESPGPSPMDRAIDAETWERYEFGLAQLPPRQREGLIMRIELQFTHQQVADALGMPSANAARMMVSRALVELASRMESSDAD